MCGLHVFLSLHLFPVHTRFMQSKQRIDWDSSPPYGQAAVQAYPGIAHVRSAKSAKIAATIVVPDFVIALNPLEVIGQFFHSGNSRKAPWTKIFFNEAASDAG
jgi:hypothetical protein